MNTQPLKLIYLLIGLLIVSACTKEPVDPIIPPEPPVEEPEIVIPQIDNDINSFMERYNIAGLSLAVTKNEKLVYAKGYGYAEKETEIKVDTSHLFRIASLSKFITAVGVMKLIEEGKLSMSDNVFGDDAVLGNDFGTPPYNYWVSLITVKHLLHHEAGGWGNSSNDPAFINPSLTVNQLISWVLDNRPLFYQPGTTFDYSNVGFQILGRIIEKKSGKSYEDYIRENVLTPSGVTNMQMGESKLDERKPNEVKYYGHGTANPYSYATGAITRLNSAGGWIASAIDLMRVMTHVDGFNRIPDILSPPVITLMTTSSDLSIYACGLRVNSYNNWWHGGSLTGTRTWIVRTATGYCWAILMNSSTSDSDFTTALDRLVWPAVQDASTEWPDIDLF